MKIKTVSMAAPVIMVLLILTVGALGFYGSHLVRTVTVNNHASAISRNAIRLDMETNRSQVLQALQHNPGFAWSRLHDHPLTVHFDTIDTVSARLANRWEEYLASITDAEERRLAQEWFTASEGLGLEPVRAALADLRSGRWDDAEDVLIKHINPRYRAGDAAMHELSKLADSHAREAEERLGTMQARIAFASGAVLVMGTALGTAVALVLVTAVVRPLREAVTVAERVADGDLTGSIDSRGNNEIGQLLAALGKMRSSLAAIVSEVHTGTDMIASASRQIAAGNLDLSERTSGQASSLEQTASSMEQLTSTVGQNAENARQARRLAVSASEVASRGGAVVADVVQTMGSISESSKKIADITGVIDGIAFQTNILALNAAVEAARAGEQGRGFAVVASEVRNLAQRSAQAAREIKELIGDSAGKVDSGARLVDQAGATMQEIVSSVQRVTDIMAEISTASEEQTAGLGQINQAIGHMDSITQQNVALVEEAAAAADALQEQAGRLASTVSVFRTDARQPVATPPAPTPAAASRPGARAPARLARPATVASADASDGWVAY
ncbi:methyl-accepting chemotaxis protein [Massilia sp. SM-13]|uniref:methyl-accepting chemotaxis protein n=1 Tax=Pseudoduganella rhizocola TaxID=3382643 RepID=UPI0038B6099C